MKLSPKRQSFVRVSILVTILFASAKALHAQKLELAHPRHGERMAWEAALPEDMHNLLSALRQRGTCSGVSCNA